MSAVLVVLISNARCAEACARVFLGIRNKFSSQQWTDDMNLSYLTHFFGFSCSQFLAVISLLEKGERQSDRLFSDQLSIKYSKINDR